MNGLRARCLDGTRVIGTFTAIPHPVSVEVTAQAGTDFVCIDCEHAQVSRGHIEDLIRAAEVHKVPAMARVPGHGPEAIAAVLDAGACGVVIPRVGNAAQAAALVKACRYPPLGERGVGPGRAGGYGYRIPDYLARANAETVVAVQVETAEGLANAGEIAATEGVDVVFIGPGDLSVSIDAIGAAGAEKLGQAIETIIAATLAQGKAAGIFCKTPQDVARWAAKGASFFILASDTMLLGAGVAAARAEASEAMET
ncbi:HpcH/HpaI aldolase family protein [Arvimicrobium flavum]|uniref:HpcH/HpaI aldolase family protein n=1 Tax=Arvimicrobium flavum TaxID=3393320 RepID=UPI00237C23C7|nr:aldolase/citrate lyase family protein [Mesorhizobium shangrilense]